MKKTLLTMMAATAALLTTAQPIEYPKAAKDKTTDTYFGTKVKARLCEWQTLIYNNFNLISA